MNDDKPVPAHGKGRAVAIQQRVRFQTLAATRRERLVREISLLGDLANRGQYTYTADDVAALFAPIEEALQQARKRFAPLGVCFWCGEPATRQVLDPKSQEPLYVPICGTRRCLVTENRSNGVGMPDMVRIEHRHDAALAAFHLMLGDGTDPVVAAEVVESDAGPWLIGHPDDVAAWLGKHGDPDHVDQYEFQPTGEADA